MVEGQVASADDAEEAEAVLRNAGIKADIWMAIHFPGGEIERAIYRNEKDGSKPSPN